MSELLIIQAKLAELTILANKKLPFDVYFRVGIPGTEQDIGAHKKIIKAHGSAPLHLLLKALEVLQDTCLIRVENFEPEVFRIVLWFLYTGGADGLPALTIFNAMDTLHCAKHFEIAELVCRCRCFVQENLNSTVAFHVLVEARKQNEPELEILAWSVIDQHTSDVIVSPKFLDIPQRILAEFLSRDQLNVSEHLLYTAMVLWAVNKLGVCKPVKVRRLLGQCVRLIRFPLMSIKQVWDGPRADNFLSDEEQQQLYGYVRNDSAAKKQVYMFNTQPRTGPPRLFSVTFSVELGYPTANTSLGKLVIQARADIAPETCEAFRKIVAEYTFPLLFDEMLFTDSDSNALCAEALAKMWKVPTERNVLKFAAAERWNSLQHECFGDWQCVVFGKLTRGLKVLEKLKTGSCLLQSISQLPIRLRYLGMLPT